MRKNTMMRFAALAAAITMTFSAVTSCSSEKNGSSSGKNKTNSQSQQGADAKELLANSYKAVPIDVDTDIEEVSDFFRIPGTDSLVFTSYDRESRIPSVYISNLDLTEIKEIETDLGGEGKNTEVYFSVTVTADGTICLLASISDFGDFELPDYEDPDFDYENFDYEAMDEARTTTYKLYCFDKEGKKISENEIKDYEKYADEESGGFYTGGIYTCGENKIAVHLSGMEESVIVVNTEGKIEGELNVEEIPYVMGMGMCADGSFAVCGSGTSAGMNIVLYDTETLKPTGKKINFDGNYYSQTAFLPGTGDYVVFACSGSAYIGIKENGEVDEIINFIDADLSQNGANYVVPLDEGFLVYSNDYDGNSGFYRLEKRDASELENTKVITIGTLYDDYTVSQRIKEFNKSHDDIRLKAISYAKYDEYDEENQKMLNSASQQLKMDIISGKAPDMIVTYDLSLVSSLSGKDVYCDLYDFMEKDSELKKDDIIPSMLSIGEHNGKLLSISPTFTLMTYAIKSKFCDKENWTFDDLKETYEKNKDKMSLMKYDSKEQVFALLIYSADHFVDYEKATCSFDSDEFVNLLEFCNQFPNEEDIMDWENASNEEMTKFYDSLETANMDEKALLYDLYLSEFRGYAQTKQGAFGGDDITLVGFPSDNGTGARILPEQSFAILNSSPNQEECWAFIKDFFLNTKYDDQTVWGFPSLKSEFEKKADEATNKPYYIDEKGEKHETDDTFYINGKEIKINPLTKEEKEYIVNYVSNANTVFNSFSDDINQILQDEIVAFFKGEKSAKDAASIIQSKVSILLSEQS